MIASTFSLVVVAGMVVTAAVVTVLGATGRLKRHLWLGSDWSWLYRSDRAWLVGNRAGAPLMCITAVVVACLAVIAIALRIQGADADLLALVTVVVAPLGVGGAAGISEVVAYRCVRPSYRWSDDSTT